MTSAVQKASQALNERGERLGRAEEKTEDMKNSAQQFAETAHKVGPAGWQRSQLWVIRGLRCQETLSQYVFHDGRYKIKPFPPTLYNFHLLLRKYQSHERFLPVPVSLHVSCVISTSLSLTLDFWDVWTIFNSCPEV